MNCKEIISDITEVPYKVCIYDDYFAKGYDSKYVWAVFISDKIYIWVIGKNLEYYKRDIKEICAKFFNMHKNQYYSWTIYTKIPNNWILIEEISEHEYRNNKY